MQFVLKYSKIYLFLLIIVLNSCITNGNNFDYQKSYSRLPNNTELVNFIDYGDGFFVVKLWYKTYYKLKNENQIEKPISIYYKQYGKKIYESTSITSEFIKAGNIPVKWNIEILTLNTIENIYDNSIYKYSNNDKRMYFSLVNEGKGILRVSLNEISIDIDFYIKTLEFEKKINYDELIQIIGYPDYEEKGAIDNWNIAIIGNLSNHRLQNRYDHYWYLYYNKYPNLKIILNNNGEVESIQNTNVRLR